MFQSIYTYLRRSLSMTINQKDFLPLVMLKILFFKAFYLLESWEYCAKTKLICLPREKLKFKAES